MTHTALHYKRSRFATRLLEHRLYTPGHSWLERVDRDLWRIGLTKFAVRMLGEIVELEFEVEPDTDIETGQVVGWLEGFKAVTDVFSPLAGRFEGVNSELEAGGQIVTRDPYGRGWLFQVRGHPGDDCLDVHGYASLLDTTIDRMLGQRHG